jgi:hypothetical protein
MHHITNRPVGVSPRHRAGVLFLLRVCFWRVAIMPFKQVSALLGLLQFTSMFQFCKLYIPHLLLEWGTTALPYLITDFRIAPHIFVHIFVRVFGARRQIVAEYCSSSVISLCMKRKTEEPKGKDNCYSLIYRPITLIQWN